ncbi:MAG: flagellar hook-basal body complex protein FliE [Sphingomonadaceae bacterium]
MTVSGANPVSTAGSVGDVLALRKQILERNTLLQELRQAGTATSASSTIQQPQTGFADSLKEALAEVNTVQQRASDLSAAYERGEVADIAQVMLARQEASVAFEATLQVRNKLMSAYQEIMRMGV